MKLPIFQLLTGKGNPVFYRLCKVTPFRFGRKNHPHCVPVFFHPKPCIAEIRNGKACKKSKYWLPEPVDDTN